MSPIYILTSAKSFSKRDGILRIHRGKLSGGNKPPLHKGAIELINPRADQFLSSFFLVDKPLGDKRFILNLRELNTYLRPPHFKLEDWRTVIRLMLLGSQMATLDLEDAYLLIPIEEGHRKYLRFQ